MGKTAETAYPVPAADGPRWTDLETELERLRREDRFRTLPARPDGLVNLSSNDYLGLAGDPDFSRPFRERLAEDGDLAFSAASSRLLTGNHPDYGRLEERLRSLSGRESALVFNSGYHMNTGILPALTGRSDLILADKLVHASLIDGIRLSEARCIRYRHQDYGQLERLVHTHAPACRRIFIVTESVFSMDGDLADLPRLCRIRQEYPNVVLYVDEAHAAGVRGACGMGLAEETGTMERIDLLCGTFGKALASVGGYVLCAGAVRDYLVNRMRPFIFTTALPPVNVAWTDYVLERLPELGERRERLRRLSGRWRAALSGAAANSETAPSASEISGSHIVPVIAGSDRAAVQAAALMRGLGFHVLPVRPPTVPEGSARLRFSLSAALSDREADALCAAASRLLQFLQENPERAISGTCDQPAMNTL